MLRRYLLGGLQLPLSLDVGLSASPGSSKWGDFVFQGIRKRMSDPYLSTKPASFTRDPAVLGFTVQTIPLVLMWVPSVPFSGLPGMKGHLQMGLWLGLHMLLSLEINTPEQRTLTKQRARHSYKYWEPTGNSWELETQKGQRIVHQYSALQWVQAWLTMEQ